MKPRAWGAASVALAGLLGACLGTRAAPSRSFQEARVFPTQTLPPAALTGPVDEGGVDSALGRRDRYAPWKDGVTPFEVVKDDRAGARDDSLARRAALRSYDGAPPVMPHSEGFGSGHQTCLDCHMTGMSIGERVAHPIPHPPYASCTQCHVEAQSSVFEAPDTVVNAFSGAALIASQPTPTTGAPPVIPHGLTLRGRCLSCHGEYGYPGLRTTHPERAACVQCHVTDAAEIPKR